MRVDIIQPAPVPEIKKVPVGSSTSTKYDSNFDRKSQKIAPNAENKGNAVIDEQPSLEDIEKINEKLKRSAKKIQFSNRKESGNSADSGYRYQ